MTTAINLPGSHKHVDGIGIGWQVASTDETGNVASHVILSHVGPKRVWGVSNYRQKGQVPNPTVVFIDCPPRGTPNTKAKICNDALSCRVQAPIENEVHNWKKKNKHWQIVEHHAVSKTGWLSQRL